MSKTTVKKAIKEFTPEQLRGLILDIYSKFKDTKEFLDFFAEPDLDKVYERYSILIFKETDRIYHRMAAPRMSRINATLKRFANLEPGYESEARLMVETAERLILNGKGDRFSQTTERGVAALVSRTCEYLERNDLLERYLPRLEKAVESVRRRYSFTNIHYNALKTALKRIEPDEE